MIAWTTTNRNGATPAATWGQSTAAAVVTSAAAKTKERWNARTANGEFSTQHVDQARYSVACISLFFSLTKHKPTTMKATTRNMAEAITQALGPVFHANPDYKTITEAIALTVARVAQSTVDRGFEHRELDDIYAMASHALTQFLNEEEARLEAKQSTLAKGIDAFAEMARSDEDDVSHEEFYRNSGLNPEHYGPANGLAAINGGVSPEACADAEEFAGRYQDEEGKLTKEGMESLTKAVIALHTPDPEEANWSNSTINEEIARFECENKDLRPNLCNPDGPRAYAP